MKSLEDNRDVLASLNTIAVGISVDSVPCKKAWAGNLGITQTPLLCDLASRSCCHDVRDLQGCKRVLKRGLIFSLMRNSGLPS